MHRPMHPLTTTSHSKGTRPALHRINMPLKQASSFWKSDTAQSTPEEEAEASLREFLHTFYSTYNPAMLSKVESLAALWRGEERGLFEKMLARYPHLESEFKWLLWVDESLSRVVDSPVDTQL
eukprot:Sspe_Gene.58883::Locus_32330_Transcript_2_3_Confidence_0.600_Length_827::g.58883::m.58883